MAELAKAGATVVGVSFDGAEKHAKFKKKYEIPFKLATDEGGKVAEAFGVKVRGAGPLKFHARDTIVIGKDARILAVLRGVDPVEHVGEVLKVLAKGG
jgi:peroxiredoxin Q/BCP